MIDLDEFSLRARRPRSCGTRRCDDFIRIDAIEARAGAPAGGVQFSFGAIGFLEACLVSTPELQSEKARLYRPFRRMRVRHGCPI